MIFLIVSLLAGLYFLISGKVGFGKTVYLEGSQARIAGLIFLAPVALALLLLAAGNVSDTQAFTQATTALGNAILMNGLLIGLAFINFHSVSRETRERGGCLTASLAYFAFVAVMLLYFSLFSMPTAPSSIKNVMIRISILEIVCIVGIWLWKKWGVLGFAILSMIAPITAYLSTGSALYMFTSLILSLSVLLVLYLLVKPKWQFFG